MKSTLVRWGGTALMIAALAGCGGGGGGTATTTTAATGTSGTTTTTPTTPTVAVPTGTAPITLTSTTAPTVFPTLTPTVSVGGVTINSPPKVTFSVTDSAGNAVIGLGSTCQSSTMTVPKYTNIQFSLAKLVPGTVEPGGNVTPARWVSYIVMSVPTKNASTGAVNAAVPTHPETDNSGTLVDNKDGTYTYTFYQDVKQVAAQVAAATVPAGSNIADLDDLTYDPTLVHRLTIEISGAAPGTGSNTPDCSVSSVPAVPLANPVDIIYDFIPATGKVVTGASGRDIASTAKCDACHNQLGGLPSDSVSSGTAVGSVPPSYLSLASATPSATLNTAGAFKGVSNNSAAAFHEGAKNDVRYCVVCHTEQQKYGVANATTTATGYSGSTVRINDFAVGLLPVHIHKIHMGDALTKTGYNFAGVLYNNIKYPQDVKNCTTCHDGTAGAANATANGDNWKNVPSREACGACHDGINFATGGGYTLADFYAGNQATSTGHIGGAQADDSKCGLCHSAANIPVYHATVTPNVLVRGTTTPVTVASQANLPAGAAKFTYQMTSVSVNATTGNPTVVFKILNNGTPVTFNAQGSPEMLTGFGLTGPNIYIAFAVPQDGITAPADFNASASSSVVNLWNGSTGTLTGPDSGGNYTAVITGTAASPIKIPSNAVMVTALLGYSAFTQNAGYNGLDTLEYPNGLVLPAQDVQMVASGYTARRQIVSTANCNTCHLQLGLFTNSNFHAGYMNDAQGCPICHIPNLASHLYDGWTASLPYWIHSIHAAAKRSVPYTEIGSAATATTAADGFFNIKYPGVLKNCTTCHLPGTFDFSAPASAAALPNRLYSTVAAGTMVAAGTFTLSPYVTAGANYGTTFSYNVATGVSTTATAMSTTLVISPIATACVACHDQSLDISHMKSNGGSFYDVRGTPATATAPATGALAVSEQCTLCHLTGKVADIAVMHAN